MHAGLGVAALVVAAVAALTSEEAAGVVAAMALALLALVTVYALWVRERYGGIYEILTSQLIWNLEAQDGSLARVTKRNRVRFIQNNVLAIPDYIWGDGAMSSDYTCTPGKKVAEHQEGAKNCVVIALDRMYKRDEELDIEIARTVRGAFTGKREWIEVKPVAGTPALSFMVIWPAGREPRDATVTIENERRNRRKVRALGDEQLAWHEGGRRKYAEHFDNPSSDEVIRVDWSWDDLLSPPANPRSS
jgi:hypothetical protein